MATNNTFEILKFIDLNQLNVVNDISMSSSQKLYNPPEFNDLSKLTSQDYS